LVDPAGGQVPCLSDLQAGELARKLSCPLRQVFKEALRREIWPLRYLRNRGSFTAREQGRLAECRAAVVGAGGLGGMVILTLARAGIGHLRVIDGDVFDETNLNRQALSTVPGLGKAKALEAARLVGEANPAVEVMPVPVRLDAENAETLLAGADLVLDALDAIPVRLLLEKTARKMGIPLVHGALAGFTGQVMTIYPEDPGLTALYGNGAAGPAPAERPEAILGVPAPTAAAVAVLQAMEAIKVLLGRGETLRNRILYLDLEAAQFNAFQMRPPEPGP